MSFNPKGIITQTPALKVESGGIKVRTSIKVSTIIPDLFLSAPKIKTHAFNSGVKPILSQEFKRLQLVNNELTSEEIYNLRKSNQ